MTQLCSDYNTLCSYDCSLPHQMSAMKDRISFLKNRLLWELKRALLVIDVVLGNSNFLTFLRIEDRQFLKELHATHERCQQLLEKDKRF